MNAAPAPSTWMRAYRPLRPRGLLAQLGVLAGVEAALLASYEGHEAAFHWATHFLVGLTAAALLNLAWLTLAGAPARGQLLWVLGLHLYAMAPDLLFTGADLPHDGWMDVFLGHVTAHYLPGGARGWLVIAVLASGVYAWTLSRWVRARRREADAGLSPGIGLSGDALVRPQLPPNLATLGHDAPRAGQPPQALLLHGLGASRRVWEPVRDDLADRGIPALVPDLLGFGASRSIGTSFALHDHVAALERLLDQTGAPPLVVAGHSFGCAVAVALAAEAPHRVESVVLVSPPVFRDAEQARERLGRDSWLARRVVEDSPVASVTCSVMCLLRRPAAVAVARAARQVPEDLARDGVQHSWPAYRDALAALLDGNPLPAWIAAPAKRTTVILGDRDRQTPASDVMDFPHHAVDVVAVTGDHLIPLTEPRRIADAIAGAAGAASGRAG